MTTQPIRAQSFTVMPEHRAAFEKLVKDCGGQFKWYAKEYEPATDEASKHLIVAEFFDETKFDTFMQRTCDL